MNRKKKQFIKLSLLYFVVMVCLLIYVLYVLSVSRERDIPDSVIAIYSLIVSTSLLVLGRVIEKTKDDDNYDDEGEPNDGEVSKPR